MANGPVINNLNLRNTLGAGIEARERSEFNALRKDAFRSRSEFDEIRKDEFTAESERTATTFDEKQKRANTEWLIGASQFAMDNPDAIDVVIQKGQEKGIIAPDLDISNVPPERLQELLQEINQNALADLGGPQQAEDTATITEFKFARKNGFKGSFADFKALNRAGGASSKLGTGVVTQDEDGNFFFANPVLAGDDFSTRQSPIENTPVSRQLGETSRQRQQRDIDTAGGKTTSTGLAERQLELPQAKSRLAATESKMDRLATAAQSIIDDDDLWKAVGLGRGLSIIPGSAGARVKAMIDGLLSKSGLAVLQDIRDNSKTGGAVGQVSNFEQKLFQDNIAPLSNLNVSPEDYRDFVQQVVDYANGAKGRFRDAFFATYPELVGSEGSTGTQTDFIYDPETRQLVPRQ